MKFRLAKKILINNGYNIIKSAHSNHVKFYNHNGSHISIPYHKDFNDMIWKRLVKENNINTTI